MYVTFVSGSMGSLLYLNLGQFNSEREALDAYIEKFKPTREYYKNVDDEEYKEIVAEWNDQLETYGLNDIDVVSEWDYIWEGMKWLFVGDECNLVFAEGDYPDIHRYNKLDCNGMNTVEVLQITD